MKSYAESWEESTCERLISRIARSPFAVDIFADACEDFADGYVMVVALIRSLRRWEGNPITGEVSY